MASNEGKLVTQAAMKPTLRSFLAGVAISLLAQNARAVLFASTGDPLFNTTEPTGDYAGSGWQYQGQWMAFSGTPIAPQYFVTAIHLAGKVGTPFTYLGQEYVTDGFSDIPDSDLRIWHVSAPFPNYAPLYAGSDEVGKELVVFGRGTKRGSALSGEGWYWGSADQVLRWGTNVVTGTPTGFLEAAFDLSGPSTEGTLSTGDSGGGVFIKDSDGVWKLAGINSTVSGPYKFDLTDPDNQAFIASLYDQSGVYVQSGDTYVAGTGPGSFYASRISANLAAIQQITGVPEPGSAALFTLSCAAIAGLRARPRSRSRE